MVSLSRFRKSSFAIFDHIGICFFCIELYYYQGDSKSGLMGFSEATSSGGKIMTIFNNIRNFIQAPVYDEGNEKKHQAELLNACLLAMIIATSIILPFVLINDDLPNLLKIVDLSIFATGLVLRFWLFRGDVQKVGIVFVSAGIVLITFAIFAVGSINTPTSANYLFFIVCSGILFNWKGIVNSTLICSILLSCLAYAEIRGWMPGRTYPIEFGELVVYYILYGFVGALSYFSRRIAIDALKLSRREIAARKISEAHLRESEAQFRSLFEQTHDAVFIVDLYGNILSVNQRASDMLGFTISEIKNMSYNNIIIEEAPFEGVMNLMLNRESLPQFERNLQRKDRTSLPVEIYLELCRDDQAQPHHIQAVARDISFRKKAEAALLASHAELEERVRERTVELQMVNLALKKAISTKDEFMAAMSHELRTPLTGILGLSQVLQMSYYGTLSEKQFKAVDGIEQSGQRLLSMIDDILYYSLLQGGNVDVKPTPCSLALICQTALEAISSTAAKKNQHTSFFVQQEQLTLNVDENILYRILSNLLKNASKFTPDNGEFGIDVQSDPSRHMVEITVWDKGIGINEQDFPRLFHPFVQLDSSLARQYEGAGLGLAIVKLLSETLGGSIAMESTLGNGSRFTIYLPWH